MFANIEMEWLFYRLIMIASCAIMCMIGAGIYYYIKYKIYPCLREIRSYLFEIDEQLDRWDDEKYAREHKEKEEANRHSEEYNQRKETKKKLSYRVEPYRSKKDKR